MKLTKSQLKQLIKEELESVLAEQEAKSPEELKCEKLSQKMEIPMAWNSHTGKCEELN